MTNRTYMPFEPMEIEMIAAANTLYGRERMAAIADIAEMVGRSEYGVRIKAARLRRLEGQKMLEKCWAGQGAGVIDRGRGPNRKNTTGQSGA